MIADALKSSRNQRGFTLVELMVVVSIIGILAAVGVPKVMAYVRTSQTAEVALAGGRIMASVKGYADTQNKTPANLVTELDGTDVTPDGSGANELSDIIPTVNVPADSQFDYKVGAIVATAGPATGEVVYCIQATARATAGVPGGLVLYSSFPSKAAGWDSQVNRTPYVKGETDLSSAVAGGYCVIPFAAGATCTSC